MAPYEFSHVALPPDARAVRAFLDLLGAEDCQLLEGWQETMLRSANERAELDQELGSIERFWDRKLRYNRRSATLYRRVGPAGLGHPIDYEPGLRARLHFAGLGARDLPPPAPTAGSATTSFGSRFGAFKSPFQGRFASSATEPRSHETDFHQKPQQ